MEANQTNRNANFSNVIAYINSSNVSHYIQLNDFKINALIIKDNIKLHHDYDEILSPHYNYAFSFNNMDALKNQNHINLGFNDIIEHLIKKQNLKKAKKPLSFKSTFPFIIISTEDIEETKLNSFDTGNSDYIINPLNKKKLISKIKLFTNHMGNIKHSTKKDCVFDKVVSHINNNLSKEEFNVNTLSFKTGYSQRQLARIVKAETDMTPVKLILELRLKKAFELLSVGPHLKIKEIQYSIGINSSSYFSKKFKEKFGYSPSHFVEDF